MSTSSSYCDYLMDQLARFGGVTLRRMFGGAGLFRDGVMFGLVAEDTCYLKADESNRQDFVAAGMGPFVYPGKGKPMEMPYYQVPVEVLDDAELLAGWAHKALNAAVASKANKTGKATGKGRGKAAASKTAGARKSRAAGARK